MEEDLSYNLINIQNYSTLVQLKNEPNIDNLFYIFQIGLTQDISINNVESFRGLKDISTNEIINPVKLLEDNRFEKFYSYLVLDDSIDEAYNKFKRVLEIYPSLLLRRMRNNKIKKTDFIMLEDFEIDETERQKWKDYRKQLRDVTNNLQDDEITLNIDNTFNIEWPSVPNIKILLNNNYYFYN